MTDVTIELNKKVWINIDKFVGKDYTIANAINTLNQIDLQPIISVTWKVVPNARTASGKEVSIESQNNAMLRKAQRLAEGIGREVEAFDNINDVTYGCVLI